MKISLPKVIFEDKDLLIIDKSANLITDKTNTTKKYYTLQDWIEENYDFAKDLDKDSYEQGNDFYKRAGLVHRIDKQTSGIIIVAKNEISFKNLLQQFKDGKVKKVYTALMHGKVIPEEGTISAPIGRLSWDRKKFGVVPMGRESVTDYKVVKYLILHSGKDKSVVSLVNIFPKTRRTHQIRVHFHYLGFPIFADELYAGRKTIQEDKKFLDRHFLHAAKILFLHPTTGERVEFESPLPVELKSFLDSLKPDIL